jgi:hypothetical protein
LGAKPPSWRDAKRLGQLVHRHGAAFIRHLLAQLRTAQLSVAVVAHELQISRRRGYELYHDYLRACARGQQARWTPGASGGDHRPAWPPAVHELLRKLLSARPPASYSFAASEVHRRLGRRLARAQVRRWAHQHDLAVHTRPVRPKAAVKRWQRQAIGELWQLDASPHPWFPGSPIQYPLLDLIDDCSRVITGARLYERELLLSYFDLLPAAFAEHGLPLALYVDCHSFFLAQQPDALTQLGWALKFYDISLLYAPTPQAKGKIERLHLFWQNRLPALFAAEGVTDVAHANPWIAQLRRHHNHHESHRELAMTPHQARTLAQRQGRSVLRPKPRCPWWPYVWSLRTSVKVAPDGTVPLGSQRLRIPATPGTRVIRCHHPDGHYTVLANPLKKTTLPLVLLRYGTG